MLSLGFLHLTICYVEYILVRNAFIKKKTFYEWFLVNLSVIQLIQERVKVHLKSLWPHDLHLKWAKMTHRQLIYIEKVSFFWLRNILILYNNRIYDKCVFFCPRKSHRASEGDRKTHWINHMIWYLSTT